MVDGKNDTEVTALLADKGIVVTRQSITAFRKRHAADLAPLVAEVERQVTDYAIANKVERIAGLDSTAQLVRQWIEERGLVELQEVQTADGATITRERFAREVSAELRALYKAAAEEMDQLPRGSVVIDNRTQVMLVRQYDGVDPEALG